MLRMLIKDLIKELKTYDPNDYAELAMKITPGDDMAKDKKHPGFKGASKEIQKKEGVSKKSADKILASGARKASKKAKAKNPRLNKVKG